MSEVVAADFDNCEKVHAIVSEIHRDGLNVGIETWKVHLEKHIEWMCFTGKVDRQFSLESVIEIMILNSVDKLM